jgi:hypothetical protein
VGLRADWAERHPLETQALVRAVYRACQWCDRLESQAELTDMLAQPRYVGEPARMSKHAGDAPLAAMFAAAAPPDQTATVSQEFLVYGKHWATFPWASHAVWFYSQMVRWRQLRHSDAAAAAARASYRPDLYRDALRPLELSPPKTDVKVERPGEVGDAAAGFFDGRVFDADNLPEYLAAS